MAKRLISHPGTILREQFFVPLGIAPVAAAVATGISPTRLRAILAGRQRISAEDSARLGRYFGMDARNWLELQAEYDLQIAEGKHGREIEKVRPYAAHSSFARQSLAGIIPSAFALQISRMQTRRSKRGVRALFAATPAQLGQAAVRAAYANTVSKELSASRRAQLERAGFKVGSVDEFLGLTNIESKLVSMRMSVADVLKSRRVELGLSDAVFARRIHIPVRAARKMEQGAADVSFDLLLLAVLAVGGTPKQIAAALQQA